MASNLGLLSEYEGDHCNPTVRLSATRVHTTLLTLFGTREQYMQPNQNSMHAIITIPVSVHISRTVRSSSGELRWSRYAGSKFQILFSKLTMYLSSLACLNINCQGKNKVLA